MDSEKAVTKILLEKEILKTKSFGFVTNPVYDLGDFLQQIKSEPNPYDSRFVFIK